ncbi:hypothetical protein PMAYCL1PPCAC_28865 [Pristionchus mayeri]|uniref:Uncharacterized protein n=1 Tax=Pristionchus mayeri TaxID=1317129 RepID=A0AAN5D9Q4_9BILA|nr:hypothetical protein PMAYCL1PPCAC_28865 [Pristionchus mayeri]
MVSLASTLIEYHEEIKKGKKWDWRPTGGFEPHKHRKLPKGHPLSEEVYQQLWAYYTYLLDRYRERKENRWFLYPGWILYVLDAAKKVRVVDPTLVEIELEKEPIKFFGNIYASFSDLVVKQVSFSGEGKTLKMHHWPEKGRSVYLGNIVNRGFHNVETLLRSTAEVPVA